MEVYKKYYKLARPDGWDFYTGSTINYRENIGKTVSPPKRSTNPRLCSDTVLHASRNPNDCFIGAKIPCSAYEVWGKAVVKTPEKFGFVEIKVVREITNLNDLFGWSYTEAAKPINPLLLTPPDVTETHLRLLKEWASVWDSVEDSVGASVWDSVRDSVWDSVRASVWDSVWDSVWASVRASVWDSVGSSVWDSVWDSVWSSVRDSIWDSVWAYIGSLFPNIKKWVYTKHKKGNYPFSSAADLWRAGLVPSYDGKAWRLHAGPKARVVWEGEIPALARREGGEG